MAWLLRRCGLPCLLLLAAVPPPDAAAQVAYRHQGATHPENEGWGAAPGNSPAGVQQSPLDPDPVGGLDAWMIDDPSTASGTTFRYEVPPTGAQLGDADVRGWTLRLIVRVVEPAGAAVDAVDASVIAEVSEGPGDRRYGLIFGTDPAGDGDPVVSVLGGAGTVNEGPASYTVQGIGDAYQEYVMTVDPVTGLATIWVGGVPRIASYAGVDAGSVAPRINWGSGQSNSTGRGHYHLVEWGLNTDRDDDGIPDSVDNCPSVQNNPPTDVAGTGEGSAPDGIGDACQCGDLDVNGAADGADVARYRAFLADPAGAPLAPLELARCGVLGNPFACTLAEVVVLRRAIAGLPPGLTQSCIAGQASEPACGDGTCSADVEDCRSCAPDCGLCLIGQACVLPEECASGSCPDGVCAAVAPVPGEPRCGDGVCNGKESCSHIGLHGCYDDCGPCSAASHEYCLDDSDCDTGTCVLEGRCDDSGEQCAADSNQTDDCGAEYACDHLAFGAFVYGGLCSDLETECRTGFLGIHQQDTCDAGDYCRRRTICNPPQTGACGAPPAFAERCPDGQQCATNNDCQSGVCYVMFVPIANDLVHVCTPPLPDGFPCTQSNDCQGLCNFGFCMSGLLPDGAPCTLHAACESGICNGFCAPGPLPNATPCFNSSVCASGLCVSGFCHADDCGDGVCNGPFEHCSSPDPRAPYGVRCQVDCGACEDGDSCVSDDDCQSGACDPFLRGCLSCRFLNDASCANGEKCDADGDCASGNCVGEQTQPYGYCAPVPTPCTQPNGRPNGCGCSSNGQCASNDCVGYDGSNWCVPNNCTAPGEDCSSSSQCCDFPGYNLSCYDFNPLPFFEERRCALNAP